MDAGCTAVAGTVTCLVPGSIPVGDSTTVTILVTPRGPGPFTTNTTVSSPSDDNLSNNGPALSTVTVTRTCAVYNSDGSRFDCGTGYSFNNVSSGSPNQTVCCTQLFPDVVISKSPSSSSVLIGDSVSYNITITNQGQLEAAGVQVVEKLPQGLTVVSAPGECLYTRRPPARVTGV